MIAALLAGVLASGPPALAPVTERITSAFEQVGRTAPEDDPALDEAAQRLAEKALSEGAARAADTLSLSEAISAAGAFDPTPKTMIIRAEPPEQAIETFLTRDGIAADPASVRGLGMASDGEQAALAVILSERKARLEPFPHALPQPTTRSLCGALVPPLAAPEVFVTRPQGSVVRVVAQIQPGRFCASLPFPATGRYTVEIVGQGRTGPQVAALFFVDVGAVAPRRDATLVEPASLEEARSQILARINALRSAQGLLPYTVDPALSRIADAYSARMAQEHFFAHLDPAGADVKARLLQAGYPFAAAGENLGLAPGPLAAQFGIELSPGHRANLLDRRFSRIGIGLAVEHVDGRTQTLLTEIFVRPRSENADPAQEAFTALLQHRTALHLPPLARSPALDGLARTQVAYALKTDFPEARLPGESLPQRVFALLDDATTASMDLFITEDASAIPLSKSAADARYDRVGVGAVRGNSPTFGSDKIWVVVIYAGKR